METDRLGHMAMSPPNRHSLLQGEIEALLRMHAAEIAAIPECGIAGSKAVAACGAVFASLEADGD